MRPALHRFDKASYFYIYYNSTRHTSRIEVANNPGTPDQDAFNGYIDTCHITNSSKFPTLMTIVVDGVTPQSPTSPKTGRDPEEWHLASGDPRDANRMKYRLHTIDVYFWAQDDAKLVVECFRKLLPASQLEIPELETEPEPEPHTYQGARSQEQSPPVLSPVVQNLENLAVHDPNYNGQYQPQRNAASPTSSFASHNIPPPPPPTGLSRQIHSPSPTVSNVSVQPGRKSSVKSNKPETQSFAPMAYNPAAPAAPEPIAHREKTPPPIDGVPGTGLDQASRHDGGYVPGPPPPQSQGSIGGYQGGRGPPNLFGGGYASPPPSQPGQQGYSSPPPPQQQTAGFSSPPPPPASTGPYGAASPSSAAGGYTSPPPAAGFSYGGPQMSNDQRSSTGAPSFGPGASSTISPPPPSTDTPVQNQRYSTAAETYVPQQSHEPVLTPGTQFYSTLPQNTKPLAHVQPQYADYLSAGGSPVQQTSTYQPPPPGGYSQYSYSQSQQGQNQGGSQYDIHQQVYRPTEEEASAHSRKHSRPSSSMNDGRKPSTTDRVEKGAKGLFKKFEKRFG